jgi:hypothetical protein
MEEWAHARTHTQHVILIASAQQQWLQERASVLRYTYTTCLVSFQFTFQKEKFQVIGEGFVYGQVFIF